MPAASGKGVSSLLTLNTAVQPKKLKLYQPAHQRYYLVASSLVCGRAGLPDRAINAGRQEKVSYVMRRMFPPGPLDINIAAAGIRSGNVGRVCVCFDGDGKSMAANSEADTGECRCADRRRRSIAALRNELHGR